MSKMLKCTINGKAVEVAEGTTIIEAFHASSQAIAHYCWHPGLSVAGACRLCMVEVQGNPRLQLACNTPVAEGMAINNASEKVKDAVKWGLDFHLINHPLDCPICDQAGECGLQDQYMQYGKYDPEMGQRKVKKHKAVDLGPRVVLDSERCILCARCVRFTDEVSKTHELGIFNRGDRSEIGTFDGRPLDNNYSLNTVDICPVGALTSKDFRFRQRVWLLKEARTVCTGCSTGCAVKVSYNKEGAFRVKPEYNPAVNGYWMCDEGRDTYKFVNKEYRQLDGRLSSGGKVEFATPAQAAKKAGEALRAQAKADPKSVALVLTAQYSVEELAAIAAFWKRELGSDRVFYWINNPETFEAFDGLLNRGDKNPNTKGLLEALDKNGLSAPWSELEAALGKGEVKLLVVAAPENQAAYPCLPAKVALFAKAGQLVWLGAGKSAAVEALSIPVTQVPMKTYVEKSGTFVNHSGLRQGFRRGLSILPSALTLEQATEALAGRDIRSDALPPVATGKTGASAASAAPATEAASAGAAAAPLNGVAESAAKSASSRVENEFTRQRGAL
jgi:NADH-quinone oxidoreductase subunit G